MRSIALINQKGGVGKTTTALNLGATFAAMGRRVLLMDLDPQANLSSWLLGPASEELELTMAEVFLGGANLEDLITPTSVEGLDLIPADLRLSGVERSLVGDSGVEALLKKAIESSQIDPCIGDPAFDMYEDLIIDCPPSIGLLTVNALVAAKEVLIPVQAHVLALNGVRNLCKVIETIQNRLHPELKIAGILICMANSRTNLSREVEELARQHFGDLVFRTTIRENVRVAECPSHFLPLCQYAPSCPATIDYRNLAAEMLEREEGKAPATASPCLGAKSALDKLVCSATGAAPSPSPSLPSMDSLPSLPSTQESGFAR